MLTVAPFRGIRYGAHVEGDLSRLTSPPYDVITAEARAALEASSPHNVVRLILGRNEPDSRSDKYTQAANDLDEWLGGGVLRRDERDALYMYEQRFALAGEERAQRGVLAAVTLADPGAGPILPHERTMPKPVEDRLALMRATAANLEPVFMVATGAGAGLREALAETAGRPAAAEFATADDGVRHRLWVEDDPTAIERVVGALRDAVAIIADGHHRYHTALLYRDERRAADGPGPWDAILAYVVDAAAGGPAVLPIHRTVAGVGAEEVLERVDGVFFVEPAPRDDVEALAAELAVRRRGAREYVVLDAERAWFLRVLDAQAEADVLPRDLSPAWRDLDVAVLHALVFDRLLGGAKTGFVHSASEAAHAVERGDASLAFLLAPVPFESVRAVAVAGEAMPPKSTYFFPKPRSGVVIRPLDEIRA